MRNISNQHGDVLLIKINSIPAEAKESNIKNRFIVEKGEGIHAHVIDDVSSVRVFTIGDTMYLDVGAPTKISHEEHGIQTIDPGVYQKDIERQFDYEKDVERRVID